MGGIPRLTAVELPVLPDLGLLAAWKVPGLPELPEQLAEQALLDFPELPAELEPLALQELPDLLG